MPDWDWLTIWNRQAFPPDLEQPVISQPGLPQVEFTVASADLERMWEALKTRLGAILPPGGVEPPTIEDEKPQ